MTFSFPTFLARDLEEYPKIVEWMMMLKTPRMTIGSDIEFFQNSKAEQTN